LQQAKAAMALISQIKEKKLKEFADKLEIWKKEEQVCCIFMEWFYYTSKYDDIDSL
jgi:hypothetical protein